MEGRAEIVEVEGLLEKDCPSEGFDRLSLSALAKTGEENDRDGQPSGANVTEDVDTRLAGHPHVAEHDIRPKAALEDPREGCVTVRDALDLSAVAFEPPREQLSKLDVIFGQKNVERARHRPGIAERHALHERAARSLHATRRPRHGARSGRFPVAIPGTASTDAASCDGACCDCAERGVARCVRPLRDMRRLLDWVHALPCRLATKFAFTFTGAALIALAIVVSVLSAREYRDVQRATAADLASQGKSLAPMIQEVWSREGESRARELLRAADAADGQVSLAIVKPDATDVRALARARGSTVVVVPLEGAEALLVLEKHNPSLSSTIFDALEVFALAGLPLALFSMVAAYFLGEWLVGGPLRRVADRARRIGGGTFDDAALNVRGSLEVSALKQAVNQMSEDLQEARVRARLEEERRIEAFDRLRHADRLTTVGTLAAGVAHELGTPLNVIYLQAQNIERDASDPALVVEGSRLVRAQASRMVAIVRQLLDFARRRTPTRTLEDLTQVAVSATALVSSLARTRNCAVDVEVGDQPVQCLIDAAGIHQILTNLLVNAFDAMPEGGRVTVRVRRGARRALNDTVTREIVCIDVEDEGTGMDDPTMGRVFEPFFTTKDVGAGTGLGLSVALGLAEDHGGGIEVGRRVPRGTVFTVWIPGDQSTLATREARPYAGEGANLTVAA